MQKYWICLVVFVLMCGCKEPIKVGAKTFSEQLVLAEIMAQLLENENIVVKRAIPYGNTRDCIQGLTSGQLDIYAEYTGTGLMILGEPSLTNREKAFTRVKEQFASLGVEWQPRLGFANNYVLVMRRDQSVSQKVEKMADLSNAKNLRIGCDEDFTKRPLDGLSAMLRRYGLKTTETMVEDDKSILYRALLDGKIDVVVGYSTDGHIEAFNLKTLEDNLHFFPVYEAAPIVSKKTLTRYPQIAELLKKLSGLIDEKTMRAMNRQVELDGVHYRDVASQFLRKHKLIPQQENKKNKYKQLSFAIENLDELSGMAGKAQQVIHKVFRGRRLKLERCASPSNLLASGKARIALVGAESFFDIDRVVQNRKTTIEAVAPVGYKMCHIIMRKDHKYNSFSEMRAIATDAENTGSHTMVRVLVKAFQLQDKVKIISGTLEEQMQSLQEKKVDCIVLLVAQNHAQLTKMLEKHSCTLFALDEWKKMNFQFRFPFLRLSRIPANTYVNQTTPVETLSSQVVLAGPRNNKEFLGDAGPVTAMYNKAQPLSDLSVLKLNEHLKNNESLDPILPKAKILQAQSDKKQTTITSYESSFANLFVIIAIVYLIYLFLKEETVETE